MENAESIPMQEVTDLDYNTRRARLTDGSEVPFSRVIPAICREVEICHIPDADGPKAPYTVTIGVPDPAMVDLIP